MELSSGGTKYKIFISEDPIAVSVSVVLCLYDWYLKIELFQGYGILT
jgi:hypothetical protein